MPAGSIVPASVSKCRPAACSRLLPGMTRPPYTAIYREIRVSSTGDPTVYFLHKNLIDTYTWPDELRLG
jgi:hypothetical protein